MLEGILITDLNIISVKNGLVMHALKKNDPGYINFGEVYFSTVEHGAIKAWKLHKEMTLNLIVPVGEMLLGFLDVREKSTTYNKQFKIVLSQNPYLRLTVPPGIWFGFKGINTGLNMIFNLTDLPHDPDEVMRKKLHEIEIDWSVE